ncbi:hypothetical protein [Prosthecobacter fluviatilis]|uniref:Flap endonuclease-1-like 5' DNA nuclease n=1 Tax=Prosthecobacter fluviatilis TaxID=445931 RepID=A0ABW0KKU8_9BACT
MKFDFESLSTEPLFYMLMHSGAFVCVLGSVFFVVGLLFGYATWGRYKRQTRLLLGEASSLKDEIASLKRKVGDHSIHSGPAVPMATEVIYMPKKENAPARAAEAPSGQDIPPPAAPAAPASEASPAEQAPAPEPPPAGMAESPPAEALPQVPHESALAAIISAPHAKGTPETGADEPALSEGLPPAALLPPLTELLLPALPEVEFQPQPEIKLTPQSDSALDPKLGFIYKSRPEKTDDLTVIEGISSVLEQRLHELGVYTHAQIAAWDDDHVKEVSARLAFKDRIRRERWVEQARELAIRQTVV